MTASLATFSAPSPGFFSLDAVQEFMRDHTELMLLVAIAIGYLFYVDKERQMMETVIEQPRQSDFFYVDYLGLDKSSDRKHRYVPMKVLEVNDAGVRFKVGNIAHSTPVSPRQHAKFDKAITLRNYYRQQELVLTFDEIADLRATGVIYNARRPKSIYIDGWIVIPKTEAYVE